MGMDDGDERLMLVRRCDGTAGFDSMALGTGGPGGIKEAIIQKPGLFEGQKIYYRCGSRNLD